MSKKKRSLFSMHKKLTFTTAAIVIFLCVATLLAYRTTKENVSQMTKSPDLPTKTLIGKVTRKNLNGRDFMINENGEKVPGPSYGIADTGDSISVDGQSFSTSCGSCSIADSFYKDIKSINLGDEVIVNYVVNESGYKTLNCRSCSIEKKL